MGKDYSPHQRKLIQNYYRNRDAIDQQRLAELVTEIYLAGGAKKLERLWVRVRTILERADGMKAEDVAALVDGRDVEMLAALVEQRLG